MVRIFLSLGSNCADREKNLKNAIDLLNYNHIQIKRTSLIYETEPYEPIKIFGINLPFSIHQRTYLNCVVEAYTDDTPQVLLKKIHACEKEIGRKRYYGLSNLPRLIDIDILFYEDKIINQNMLKIPHPRLHLRSFVLIPFCDLEPNFRHPVLNKTMAQLLNDIKKQGVWLWQKQISKTSA